MALAHALQDIIDFFIQVFIIFPYSAFTIRRQLSATHAATRTRIRGSEVCTSNKEVGMISDDILQACTLEESVTSWLAANPSLGAGDAWKKLYGDLGTTKIDAESYRIGNHHEEETSPALQRAEKCGKWGDEKPSELFLKIFHDSLGPLEKDMGTAMVSPSLMGSSGVVPLTIISTVPDIMRHQANLIVQAQSDIFFATNYWQNSVASSFITNAMRELSARRARTHPNGPPIIMKMIYDRGSVKQIFDNHHIVSAKEILSPAVGLPRPEEIPNIDLQVMNYHRPMLGTFHCKYMIVDRKVAVLQSNNVQDNDNLEMMVELQGAIVDSLYDMALISWDKAMKPNLPTLGSPAKDAPIPCLSGTKTESGKDISQALEGLTTNDLGQDAGFPQSGTQKTQADSMENSWIDVADSTAVESQNELTHVTSDPTHADPEILDAPGTKQNANPYAPPVPRKVFDTLAGSSQQHADIENPQTVQMKNATAPPAQAPNSGSEEPLRVDPVTEAYLNSGKPALTEAFILDPSPGSALQEHTPEDPHYDSDLFSEVRRVQCQVSDNGDGRLAAISNHLNHTKNPNYAPPHSDIRAGDEWTPYIAHSPTKPFPMALVNRWPHGAPEHSDVYVPQNEAWLAALRYAKESVFIQSPTLNADVLVPAIIEACERGIDVFCFICLGYNDSGELLPMQGGTNEQLSTQLYASLSEAGKKRLHYHYYVAADHLSPLRAQIKIRSCHVKLMIVDSRIAICGNGNMDTQSWYQSAEVNVLFEHEETCRQIIDGLRRCQRTGRYGRVAEDGLWRDAEGNEVDGGLGLTPKGGLILGLKGAIGRVRGEGDFR